MSFRDDGEEIGEKSELIPEPWRCEPSHFREHLVNARKVAKLTGRLPTR